MGVANSLNKGNKFNFTIPENFKYKKLSELVQENGYDYVYRVNAVYINTRSKYGNAPVIATDCELVNLPNHLMPICEHIRSDKDCIEAINNGTLGFKIYSYQRGTATYYSVNWVDL